MANLVLFQQRAQFLAKTRERVSASFIPRIRSDHPVAGNHLVQDFIMREQIPVRLIIVTAQE